MTKSKQSTHSQEEAYRLPREQNRDIADVACRIMDGEGPTPMRDFRPAQKQQTAAEQFEAEHQAAYEARGGRSRDRVEDVRRHNAAHPMMYDELNKRRSTAKATAVNAQLYNTKESVTRKRRNTSRQGKNLQGSKRRRLAPDRFRENAKASRHPNSCVLKRRTKDKRTRFNAGLHSLSKFCSNIGCQCSNSFRGLDKKSGTTDNVEFIERVEEGSSQNNECSAEDGQRQNSGCPSGTSQHSKNDSIPINPDTDGSMSSYNSFASLGHEPMV